VKVPHNNQMKRDGYNFESKWIKWKEKNFKGINQIRKEDSKVLIEFLKDMELGMNVPKEKKGKRSAGTLLNLAEHNILLSNLFKKPFLKLKKIEAHELENKIEKGVIKRKNGKNYIAFGNYIKDGKAFYNWMVRTGRIKENIFDDISSKTEKPHWVYLTEEQAKEFFNKLTFYYRALTWFMYDTGARVTEANSIQIKHFSKNFTEVTIPDEASKTFGRTINLKLCTNLIKELIETEKLKDEDFIFQKDLWTINKYLKYNCGKIFGKDKVSNPKSKGAYGNFTLYDIRHNSSCYWLNRYPKQTGLMYRFGWKNADKIEYYSEFLGQKDSINDADLITNEDMGRLYEQEKEIKKQQSELEKVRGYLKTLMGANESMIEAIKNINDKLNISAEAKKKMPEALKKKLEEFYRKELGKEWWLKS